VAFLTLTNLSNEAQTAIVVLNIEGVSNPYRFTRTIAPCNSTVVGVHALPNFPSTGNFRVQVGWPGIGGATLIMRPNTAAFWDREIIPPVMVIR
jgi:hypothetical protein